MMAALLAATSAPIADPPALLAAWLITAAALAVALTAGRRLWLGVGDALFVGGVTAVLILNYFIVSERGPAVTPPLSAGLLGLAALWLIAGLWIERARPSSEDAVVHARRVVRQQLSVFVAALSAVLVAPLVWFPADPRSLPTRWLLTVALCVVLAAFWVFHRSTMARWGLLAGIATAAAVLGDEPLLKWRHLPNTLLLLALLAILAVCATILVDWRRRERWSRGDPRALLQPSSPRPFAAGFVVLAGALVSIASPVLAPAGVPLFAPALASVSCLAVAHRWQCDNTGALGLLLAGEIPLVAAWTFFPSTPANWLLGGALGGLWMLWLARFWHQQLDDGRAWTTAGRLIPVARRLSYAAAALEFSLAAYWFPAAAAQPAAALWIYWLAGGLVFLHGLLLARDSLSERSPAGALLAGALLLAAGAVAQVCVRGHGGALPLAIPVACVGLVLALRVMRAPHSAESDWAWNAWIGAATPLLTAYAVVADVAAGRNPYLAALGALIAALAVALHRRRASGHPPNPA